jgi:hypothetical protein
MNASEDALAELSEKIKIDQDNLDVELVTQTNDYYHASRGHALAVSLRDQAKNNLDVAEAELYLMFRREAGDRVKLTEAQLDATVKSNEIRQEYFTKYLETKLLADKWLSLRDSFIQKGHALRELAELYKLNYFGERATSASLNEVEARVRNRATGQNDDH